MPFCERIVAVPKPRAYSPTSVFRGLVGRWPLPVVNYTSGEMKSAIAAAAANGVDAVHFEGVNMAAYIPFLRQVLPGRPITFNWHNIESEAMERYAASASSLARRMYARVTAGRLAQAERFILQHAAGNFVCSERERRLLAASAPEATIAVSENGVDTAAFTESTQSNRPRERILFVGLMAYHANADAAVWFVRNVWPELRQRMPGKVLTIVGAEPGPAVLALRSEPGVEVTGTVPDVRPYYEEAFTAVVPLRVGAGTRLKILESMAAGVPVISTAVGAEGLDVRPGENILLAETAEQWVLAIESLTNDALRKNLTGAARVLVSSRYDWRIIRENFFKTYASWVDGAARQH
jgi:glycosyltransferase involved in cell wall biosynthesis